MGKRKKSWRRPPYYIVCGMPRGGTSMMMQSLIAGGMQAHYVNHEDLVEKDRQNGYRSNPVDAYEWEQLENPLPKRLRGRLLKMFPWHMLDLEPGPFKVILITRETEQIRRSVDKYLEYAERTHGKGQANLAVQHAKNLLERENMDELFEGLKVALPTLPTVRDVEVVDYAQVCERPLEVFTFLKERGWPIDVEAAAAVPNPKWRSS